MPTYEYQCSKCEKIHEVIQKFSDPPLSECPECGGKVSKLLSLTSFALKGSGWYTTDYKRAGSGGAKADAGGANGAKSESAAAAPAVAPKSEAKPSANTTGA